MSRPLFKKATEELEQLFRECADSPEQLIIIAAELVHRQRPKALALRKEVEAALAKRGKPNTAPALSSSTDNSYQDLLKAAMSGDSEAEYQMGVYWLVKTGKKSDKEINPSFDLTNQTFEVAREWFQRAAKQEHENAKLALMVGFTAAFLPQFQSAPLATLNGMIALCRAAKGLKINETERAAASALQSQLPQTPNHNESPARQAAAQAYVDSVIQGQPNTKIFGSDLAKAIANEEKQKEIQKRDERHVTNTVTPNPEKEPAGAKVGGRSKNMSWTMLLIFLILAFFREQDLHESITVSVLISIVVTLFLGLPLCAGIVAFANYLKLIITKPEIFRRHFPIHLIISGAVLAVIYFNLNKPSNYPAIPAKVERPVHVDDYSRSDGTYVSEYNRAPAGQKLEYDEEDSAREQIWSRKMDVIEHKKNIVLLESTSMFGGFAFVGLLVLRQRKSKRFDFQ